MTTVAIITARAGSKRIPHKNIRHFCGKPIIAYPISAALETHCFDEVMVSTDDEAIASVARQHGAAVPFMRSASTSTDTATTAEAVAEVLNEYAARGRAFDLGCCIYPTAAFVTPDMLRQSKQRLIDDASLTGLISVTKFSYPIQRALRLRGGQLSFFQPEHVTTRSQDLEPAYHDAGQFYWFRVAAFLASRTLIAPGTAAFTIQESEVQDIDSEEDWVVSEAKFQRQQAASPGSHPANFDTMPPLPAASARRSP